MSKTVQWLLLIFVGGLAGVFVGELLASMAPSGLLKDILSETVDFGIHPPGTLDLKFLALTIGFQVKMTLIGLVGLGLAFWVGRKL